jgi:osmoprotectant transport system permease protein
VGGAVRGQDGHVMDAGFFTEVGRWFADPLNWSGPTSVPVRLVEHLWLSGIPLMIATVVALPLGLFVGHTRRLELLVVSVANIGRAIPTFAVLVILVMLLGLGDEPIILALTLLAIPPILTNTYVGIQQVDPDTIESARGMGMTGGQVLGGIEVRLAAPVVVAGLRTAAVTVVATATLAALIGGGGLGRIIVDGLAVRDLPQVFSGALLVALLAITVEIAFAGIRRWVSPRTRSQGRARTPETPVLQQAS